MGFLAPWFLAGMAAVGLPLYLHLLRRHATTPRPFSSFSMRAGSRLSDAKREAMSVLGSRRLSERVQIMALDSQLHVLTEPTQDRATGRAILDGIHASDSRGSFGELVRAVRLTADSVRGPIELHLFSDMQRSNMAPSITDMVLPDTVT